MDRDLYGESMQATHSSNRKQANSGGGLTSSFWTNATLTQCTMSLGETPPKADHFPIHTTIGFSMKGSACSYSFNYRAIEWDIFITDLIKNLKKIPEPQQIDNEDQFHNALSGLTKAIRDAIEKVILKCKPLPHSK